MEWQRMTTIDSNQTHQSPHKSKEKPKKKTPKKKIYPPIDVDPFVCIGSVSQATNQSTRTVRRKIKSGDFPPAIRMGGKLVWRLSTIRKWMAETETNQTGTA
jgi:predicted DNA-binding transcriptional regulator AlpA